MKKVLGRGSPIHRCQLFESSPMLMSASSEFVALCQAQVQVIQGLGASLSAVYLTTELVEDGEAKLIPVVAYPTSVAVWKNWKSGALLPDPRDGVEIIPGLPEAAAIDATIGSDETTYAKRDSDLAPVTTLLGGRRIVLPLMHEGVVMGLLVTERQDRAWEAQETSQIEEIAHTMAIACVMDRRRGWLEQQLNQANLLQEQQNDLLHNLLHQLRNPLTALRTFGKLLLKRLGLEDPNRDIAANILREGDRIQELLQQFDQVLELTDSHKALLTLPPAHSVESISEQAAKSQSAAGKPLLLLPDPEWMTANLAAVSVAEVLEPLLVSGRAIAAERYLHIETKFAPNLPLVRANRQALREVLSNLIDNALKYTPAGGQVYIEVGQESSSMGASMLYIAVSDTGPGIPAQDLEHLFERHYRGVQAQTAIPGTGLGLAIAKELIEKMQGEIQAISPGWHSQAQAPGVTFVVWLPTIKP